MHKLKPEHFHFAVDLLLAGVSLWSVFEGRWVGAVFLALGTAVALIHGKAAKTGFLD